jgi:hypothetical protein
VATTRRERKALHRQGFESEQVAVMGQLVADKSVEFDTQPILGGRDGAIDDDHAITGPEFLFHGSKADWDTIYASGGLKSQGSNIDLSAHVHSSSTAQSAFVSGSRVLSVAKRFAGDSGWIYLIYVPTGIGVFSNPIHKQAEVAALECVPVKDLLMCKQVTEPSVVYVNKECRSVLATPQNLDRGLRLIGGGQYPQGQFWTVLA